MRAMIDEPYDNFDWLTELCSKADGSSADLMYGDELVYKVGEEMFCIFHLEGNRKVSVSFHPAAADLEQLRQHPGIETAAFPAGGEWLCVTEQACATQASPQGISREELAEWIKAAYTAARQLAG